MNNSRTLRVRVNTAANWTSENPTLESGMIGLESDTSKMKRGDGSSTWTALPYIYAQATHTHVAGDITGLTFTTRAAVLELQDTFGIFN